jgi:hypothetical protein
VIVVLGDVEIVSMFVAVGKKEVPKRGGQLAVGCGACPFCPETCLDRFFETDARVVHYFFKSLETRSRVQRLFLVYVKQECFDSANPSLLWAGGCHQQTVQ